MYGFIRVYDETRYLVLFGSEKYDFIDETRYLVLFGSEKYDFIYNRIRYLIGIKCDITSVLSHNYAKVKMN